MGSSPTLQCALGNHKHVEALKSGVVTSDRLRLSFLEYDPIPRAFRAMVRGNDLDVSEMALTTYLLALEFGKPLVALPIPVWGRLHHGNLVCLTNSKLSGPKDLEGKKVGVRAYSQTTGVWIRGILKSQYGVDLSRITWVTTEGAHVAEYLDPPNVVRSKSRLRDLLYSGEVAAIMGEREVDPSEIRTVIPDSEAAARQWSRETGIVPVNHIVSVRAELLDRLPFLATELMGLFEQARAAAGPEMAAPEYGLEANRAAIQMLFEFAADQKLTTKVFQIGDVFPV